GLSAGARVSSRRVSRGRRSPLAEPPPGRSALFSDRARPLRLPGRFLLHPYLRLARAGGSRRRGALPPRVLLPQSGRHRAARGRAAPPAPADAAEPLAV